MKTFGLALSGGGFRASLYHLGLVRFLRDAGILQNVSHITSVSGGSVIGAHLGLNWGRYTGSASEFDAAASELLDYVRLDIRNRILRRYGLGFLLRWPRRLIGLSNRRYTRTGLLEYLYEKHLYGDTSLFQLPESPKVHILTTNLSEGRLCSFSRDGLQVIRSIANQPVRIDRIPTGLATVAMAVTASSAFPGFFPPLVLTGADVGANQGAFGRQAFTDGGIFDNLGVRMFRYIEQSSGKDRFPWDGVLVSDVGKPFEVLSSARTGGLIRTAMRASDILSDRVWQLENETFGDTTGFVFARVTDLVHPEQDATAPHVEIQRQLPNVRTDFDRFSPTEINNLIRHGYCVARKACRSAPDVFGKNLPDQPPWDPQLESQRVTTTVNVASADKRDRQKADSVTRDARTLYSSAFRRIWGTLLDYRDWVSYIYVPILIPILTLLPYLAVKTYEHSHRVNQLIESLAQSSRDLEQMSILMDGPITFSTGETAEEILGDVKFDNKGFTILQDSRIIDLRKWKPVQVGDAKSQLYGYRRLKVLKQPENTSQNQFAISVLAESPKTQVRFPSQYLTPTLHTRSGQTSGDGKRRIHWEVHANFEKVTPGEPIDIIYEHTSPGLFVREGSGSATLAWEVEVETIELNRWLLLPEGKEFREYRLIRFKTGKPETADDVKVVSRYLAEDNSILAFKLLALDPGYTYELTWY